MFFLTQWMKTHVVSIGNSKGVRLTRTLLDLCHIRDAVNLSVKGETIIIRPVKRRPRAGWHEAFQKMHERHEDRPLIEDHLQIPPLPG